MELISLFIPSLWQFIVLIVWMHLSVVIAYLLQWNPKFSILQINAFQIYPWKCEKCLTFWTNLIPNIILAYIWNPMFILWGLISAGCLAYSLYLEEKGK